MAYNTKKVSDIIRTEWFAHLRRHNANIFDVFFKDIENIGNEDVVNVAESVAKFFGLPLPVLHDKCETIAEVMVSGQNNECELYYNWQLMEKAGINNVDTQRLSLVHELSHQLLSQTRFLLFENELWIQELAADMIVGAFSTIGNDVATGKYKYVLKQLPVSMSHPNGELRAAIVEYGREYAAKLKAQGELSDIKDVLKGLPTFVYSHYHELKDSWNAIRIEGVAEEDEIDVVPIDYESLPDSNLLKQYYLKHVKNKEDEI